MSAHVFVLRGIKRMTATKRKILKLTIVFELLILLMITGCGKKNIEEYDYYRCAYIAETTVVPDVSGDVMESVFYAGTYYVLTKMDTDYRLYRFTDDAKDVSYKQLQMEDCERIISVSAKNCLSILVENKENEVLLHQIDYDGNVIKTKKLDYVSGEVNDGCLISADSGKFGIINNGKIDVYDQDFKKESVVKIEDGYIVGAVYDNDKIFCCVINNSGLYVARSVYIAEIKNGEINKLGDSVYDISGIYGRIILENTDGSLYVRLHDGIYAFDGKKKLEKKLDYFDSMLLSSETENIVIDDDKFIRIVSDEAGCEKKIYSHTKDEKTPNKKIIEFGRFIPSEVSSRMIMEFNKENSDYYIRVKDYGFEDGISRFNLDVIAGNAPDIIDFSGYNKLDYFVQKGWIESLNAYIENEPEISECDFIDTYFEACSIDKNIYFVSDSFYINTLVTEKNEYISEYDCTTDELLSYIKESDNADIFPWESTRADIYMALFSPQILERLDYQSGSLEMESEQFERIGSVCYDLGVEKISGDYKSPDFNDQVQAYKEDRALFWTEVTPSEIFFLNYIFDNNVCYAGYPEGGSYFVPRECLCISSGSDCKDECWEFLKKFMTYEHQKKIALEDGDEIPTRKDCFDLQCERMCADAEYTDDSGNRIEPISGELNVKYAVINKEPLSEEDIDHLKKLIEHTHKCTRYDEKAIEIVMSEMDEYFNDKHDLKIAEEIIKNRLATYLSESQ